MPKHKDLTGQRFGYLEVLKRLENRMFPGGQTAPQYLCKCACGNEVVVLGQQLVHGRATSCGCYRAEAARKKFTTHGLSNTRLSRIWRGMKDRCCNPKSKIYKHYGGRGITVCDEWKDSFESFYEWAMSNGYSDELSIDRINNDGNYEPLNCRWVDDKHQCNNRRSNHVITYNGETHTLQEWAEKCGVEHTTLLRRIRKGLSIVEVLKEVT